MLIRILFMIMFISIQAQSQQWANFSTKNFLIHYEKNISQSSLQYINDELTKVYKSYEKTFGRANQRLEIFVCATVSVFKSKSSSRIFEDGDVVDGIIYLVAPKTVEQKTNFHSKVSKRIIACAILEQFPGIPKWLAESYSLYAGGYLDDFGEPARFNISSFYDLNEDYNHATSKKDVKELYAKLAATAKFLINRYGDLKVERMLRSFDGRKAFDEVFETSFNEKISDIERAWVKALQNQELR